MPKCVKKVCDRLLCQLPPRHLGSCQNMKKLSKGIFKHPYAGGDSEHLIVATLPAMRCVIHNAVECGGMTPDDILEQCMRVGIEVAKQVAKKKKWVHSKQNVAKFVEDEVHAKVALVLSNGTVEAPSATLKDVLTKTRLSDIQEYTIKFIELGHNATSFDEFVMMTKAERAAVVSFMKPGHRAKFLQITEAYVPPIQPVQPPDQPAEESELEPDDVEDEEVGRPVAGAF